MWDESLEAPEKKFQTPASSTAITVIPWHGCGAAVLCRRPTGSVFRWRYAPATATPRSFGYGHGLTFYTWTSDQFSQLREQADPLHGPRCDLRARRYPRQRNRAADCGAHFRHGWLHGSGFSSALPVRRAASAAHRRTDQQGRGLARATRIPLCGKRSVPISRWQKQQEAGFG
jgi:hypothetical protein